MSSSPDGSLEQLLAKRKEETGETTFTPEAARLAGVKSGAARRPVDKDKDARRAYSYVAQTLDVIAARLLSGYSKCPHCKRGGPIDPRLLDSLSRTLNNLSDTILAYAWGRPAQESKSKREGSIEDFKRAQREVNSEDNKSYLPPELASVIEEIIPSEETEAASPEESPEAP